MNIRTINVVEYADDTVQQVVAYPDTPEGNGEAEAMFKACAMENGMAEVDTVDCLNDGLFEQGDYQVFIVHSS
jgi:hypothetical protein